MKVSDEQLKVLIPDLPISELDVYRKKALFDWRRMKLSYDTLDTIKLKNDIWEFMRNHPLFQHPLQTPSLDDDRHVTTKRMYALYNERFLPSEKLIEDPRALAAESEAMFMFNSSLAVKLSLTFRMFANTIRGSGKAHHYHYIEDAEEAKIGGCFALTEIAHGSNAKGMRTTATYCPEKKMFILHSEDFEAAKCWVGSLATRSSRSRQNGVKRGQVALLACTLQMHQKNHISRGCASSSLQISQIGSRSVKKQCVSFFTFKSAERPSVFPRT
ncbi:Peroxisomal acyl-coenzyme A oxidase 3 [Eumeta japonica]|uniref:Peroxisomal acyl-coenzyme A oxidase 3 n=1 Tax=Eumeta variegata TaxID=151549 RepID=A0A4C1TT60_EUMVA|nr:Peroxisomal acyl-coenzyme A oxidase 3 [Eumeta japonica]